MNLSSKKTIKDLSLNELILNGCENTIENVSVSGNILIYGDSNKLINIALQGKIFIFSSSNYFENIHFSSNDDGIIVYQKAMYNHFYNCFFYSLNRALTIYGNNNIITNCIFCNNEFAIIILGKDNLINKNQIFLNKKAIINKNNNRVLFNIFKLLKDDYTKSSDSNLWLN